MSDLIAKLKIPGWSGRFAVGHGEVYFFSATGARYPLNNLSSYEREDAACIAIYSWREEIARRACAGESIQGCSEQIRWWRQFMESAQ